MFSTWQNPWDFFFFFHPGDGIISLLATTVKTLLMSISSKGFFFSSFLRPNNYLLEQLHGMICDLLLSSRFWCQIRHDTRQDWSPALREVHEPHQLHLYSWREAILKLFREWVHKWWKTEICYSKSDSLQYQGDHLDYYNYHIFIISELSWESNAKFLIWSPNITAYGILDI